MIASGRTATGDDAERKTHSANLFIIAVCGFAAASTLARHRVRLLKYVAMPARIIIGTPTPITATVEFGEGLQPCCRIMVVPQRRTEQFASRKCLTSVALNIAPMTALFHRQAQRPMPV
jgi:hypothetical protein